MRAPALIRGSLAVLALAFALAPAAQAGWSEQGVVIDTLSHSFNYDRATLLHDVSGAYFVYLPYTFGDFLLHLDSAQTGTWATWPVQENAPPASATGNAVALDGSGSLFVLEQTVRLHHVLPNGAQDWGDPVHGLAVGSENAMGGDLVADGTGGVWGTWAASGGVRLQHWLAGGTVAPGWGPAGLLFPGGMCPALARDGTGGVLLCFGSWLDDRTHVTRVQADTTITPAWTAEGLDLGPFSFSATEGFHPLLLPSGDTGWIAIWPGPNLTTACARRFFPDGTLDLAWGAGNWRTLVTYVDGRTGTSSFPATFSDGAGGFHHVWPDSATLMPRWLHVTAAGGCAAGFGWNGIPVLSAADGFDRHDNFVAAPSDNGGIVFAWDDTGAGRAPAVRLRWLMPDGTNDPAAPDTGRVIPGTNSLSHIWGLDGDGLGGVFTLWASQGQYSEDKIFIMNHMGRTPDVAAVPPPARGTTLALASPRPTPTRGALDVRCTLASQAPATLSLFDVSGRRLRDVTLEGAGDHVAHLDPRGDLPQGVYLLRLTQGRESRAARAVVLR